MLSSKWQNLCCNIEMLQNVDFKITKCQCCILKCCKITKSQCCILKCCKMLTLKLQNLSAVYWNVDFTITKSHCIIMKCYKISVLYIEMLQIAASMSGRGRDQRPDGRRQCALWAGARVRAAQGGPHGAAADLPHRRQQDRPALQPRQDDLERQKDIPHRPEEGDRPAPHQSGGRCVFVDRLN